MLLLIYEPKVQAKLDHLRSTFTTHTKNALKHLNYRTSIKLDLDYLNTKTMLKTLL